METILENATEWGTLYGVTLIGAIAILFIGRVVVGMVLRIVRRILENNHTDGTLTSFALNVIKTALYTILVIAVLNQVGIQTTSLVAILGAAGLAIGFALQGSLANLAAGVLLIAFRPFKSGDYIEAGGTKGSVVEIGIFNTVLNTPDNKRIIVPNSNITGANIINFSAMDKRRADFVFGIGYDDDLKKAKQILLRLLNEDPRILDDPAPFVAVSELAESSVNFVVRAWVKSSDFWVVHCDLLEKVKLTFDDEGISIPFPQREIHMNQSAAA